MLDNIRININKIIQDLLPWFERQTNRLEWMWLKNKPLQDVVEKWDRDFNSALQDAQFNTQVMSFEGYLSKKLDDFYLLYPLEERNYNNSWGINWENGNSINMGSWFGLVYGNGIFVSTSTALAYSVMTSPDGINWTILTGIQSNSWNCVTYGGGLFVALSSSGTGNRVMTSPDGINWTIGTCPDQEWRGIIWKDDLFVAVSSSGTNRVMTSPDGINWTIRTTPVANQWWAITYGNGLFVSVARTGVNNKIMTSPDGINWTIRYTPVDNIYYCITWGEQNKLFVASSSTGDHDKIMTSPDGINWTIRYTPDGNVIYSITEGNGVFVGVGAWGETRSPDGIEWFDVETNINNVYRNVIYVDGMFVAISSSGDYDRVRYSGTLQRGDKPTSGDIFIADNEYNLKLDDILNRGFGQSTYLRLRCYIQPIMNNKIPYINIIDDSGVTSETIGLSGGWNDVDIQFTSTSSTGSTYISFRLDNYNEYRLKDLGIFYRRTSDILLSLDAKEYNEYIIYDDAYMAAQPWTDEFIQYDNDTNSIPELTINTNTNISPYNFIWGDFYADSDGTVGSGGGSILFDVSGVTTYGFEKHMFNYANLFLTGNTGIDIILGYDDGGFIELEVGIVFSHIDNNITIFDWYDNTRFLFTGFIDSEMSWENNYLDYTYSASGADAILTVYNTSAEVYDVWIDTSDWNEDAYIYVWDEINDLVLDTYTGGTEWKFSTSGATEYSVWVEVKNPGEYFQGTIYFSRYDEIVHGDYPIQIKLTYGDNIDFNMDFQFQKWTGIIYSSVDDPLSGEEFIIYIDSNDFMPESVEYLDKAIDTKRPAGSSYTYIQY